MCRLPPRVRWAVVALSLQGFQGLLPGGLPAQTRARQAELSDSAVVSLITILPGRSLYNVFGHTLIRVRDPATGLDVGYNYGTFDFPDSFLGGGAFVARFAYGRLDYRLDAPDYSPIRAVEWYWREEGRASVEQTLDFSPQQRRALYRSLEENARPENATYRYDFFFDNCSTRPRDQIESALGGELRNGLDSPGASFRQLLDPYLVERPGLNLAMDLGLGPPADRLASARDAAFLPEWLMRWADAARVDGPGGARTLVSRTDTLTWAPGAADRTPAPAWPRVALWLVALAGVWLTIRDLREGRRFRRWLDGALFTSLGLAGVVLAFLVFVSIHEVTKGNLNLLWAVPLHLAPGVALLAGRRPGWLRGYMLATLALLVVFLVGWPVWPQEIPGAVLPVMVLVAARAGVLALPRPSREVSSSSSDQTGEASSR
jgi:hypothetical protein